MSVKPFLKWVGGKRQLLDKISPLIPADYQRYIEPFVGEGRCFSAFLASCSAQKLRPG